MKKLNAIKKTGIILCLITVIMAATAFAGCVADPYEVEWHFEYCKTDDEIYITEFDYYNHFRSVSADAVQISFNVNGSFYFKNYDGSEYNGTYKCKENKKKGYTEITLIFPDGSQAKGHCGVYGFDGIWYEAEFKIFGATYYFDTLERTFSAESSLSEVANAVYTFATTGEKRGGIYYNYLETAVIEKVGNSYIAKTADKEYTLDDAKYWCYIFNSENIRQSELREGECIIRAGIRCFAIYYPEINE